MSEQGEYRVRKERDDRGYTTGYAIDDPWGRAVRLVDELTRSYDESTLLFANVDHADDFAAAINLGFKARQAKPEGGE